MEQHIYSSINLNETSHWWFVSRRKIIRKILATFFTPNPTQTILEIGCGSGGNLSLLSEFGSVHGIEKNDEARTIAANKKVCMVTKGSLPNDITIDESFDLVCLFDVIEHIANDTKALLEVGNKIKPKGRIFLTVPAYQFLWSSHDIANRHQRRYTLKKLKQLIIDSGYKVLYISYFNTFLFPIVILVRAFQKLFSIESNIEYTHPSKFINSILCKVFSFESLFIPKISFPFGVSILLLAENEDQQ